MPRKIIIILAISFLSSYFVQAQINTSDSSTVIELTGIVTEGDSLYAVPGVRLFVQNTYRGASTSLVGFFALPVLPNDTVNIVAVGYQRQQLIIPDTVTEDYTVMLHLALDTVVLPTINVSVLPSEDIFKKAFLALDVSSKDATNARNNLDEQILSRVLASTDIDASTNYTYYIQQQVQAIENQYIVRQISLLDPFAWARFVKSIKEERERKKREKKKRDRNAGY